jgi:hypothetical protein
MVYGRHRAKRDNIEKFYYAFCSFDREVINACQSGNVHAALSIKIKILRCSYSIIPYSEHY